MPKNTPEIDWYLPPLNGGEDKGLNDAGIKNFNRSQHLARETVQNIIDAHDPSSGGVATAEFEVLKLQPGDLPGLEHFRDLFTACVDRVTDGQDDSGSGDLAVKFVKKGARLLSRQRRKPISVLRIRDLNTVGLEGDDETRRSRWYRLVRGQGTANIEGAGGGTYGIGQRAPFAFSGLRTVFYSTMLPDGGVRFMGKFILCTCEHPDNGKLTQNIGYYGTIHQRSDIRVRSIAASDQIPPFFRRSSPGTDIYVVGFTLDDLRTSVVRSVLVDFYAAIAHGKLEVVIREGEDRTDISAQSISQILEEELSAGARSRELLAAKFGLEALSNPEGGKPYTTSIEPIGEVRLYVARSPHATNQIAHMRVPRMKVYQRTSNKLKDYQAVVLVDNDAGNRYLAALEDPGHERWNSEEAQGWSSSERAEARRVLRDLNRFVNEILSEIRGQSEVEQEDIPELAKLLPVEVDDETMFRSTGTQPTGNHQEEESPLETLKRMPPKVTITPRPKRAPVQMVSEGDSGAGSDEGITGAGGDEGEGGTGSAGEGEAEGAGTGTLGGDDPGHRITAAKVQFRSWRSGGRDSQVYRLVLSPKETLTGSLILRAAGEQKNFPVNILDATDLDSGSPLDCADGAIRSMKLTRGKVRRLEVKLDSDVEVSLAVEAG